MSSRFERLVAANWLIWVGALALALGGVFLVRFAWEQGYFGPTARTIAAVIAGAAMIAASEWMRRKADPDAPGQMRFAPLATATAGVITLYAAAYAAGPLYGLVPPGAALAGFVAASAVAVVLAVMHGAFLAALGLTGGFIAPLLVGGSNPEPLLVLGYALAVTGAALVLVRAFNWQRIVWVALAGAALWTLIGLTWMDLPNGPLALPLYLLALVAASTALAWKTATVSPVRAAQKAVESGDRRQLSQTAIAANGFWILAAAGLVLPLKALVPGTIDPVLAAAAVFSAGSIFAAWRRQGFELVPLLAAGVVIVIAGTTADSPDDVLRGDGSSRFTAFMLASAAVTGAGGWLAMRGLERKTFMAIVSAFTPPILFAIAFQYMGEAKQDPMWGAMGAGLALLNLLALEGLHRAKGGLDAAKGAAAAYALAAFGSSLLAVATSLGGVWMTAAFAALLPGIAFVDRRFDLPALRLSASAAGMIVMARVIWPETVLSYQISTTPVINELLIIYGAPIFSFWLAARIYATSLRSAENPLVQAFDVAAIAAGAAFLSVEIRHLVTGGDLRANYEGLVETGAYATAWSSLALGLAARQGKTPRLWLRIAERIVVAVAAAIIVLGLLIGANPLVQPELDPATFAGPPLLNLIAPSYLGPAVIFGAYGLLRRRQGLIQAGNAACYLALALVLLYATIEVRNVFHDSLLLANEPILLPETSAYAVAWAVFAMVLALVDRRKQEWLEPAERIVFAITGAIAVIGLGLALNPLIRIVPEASALDGPPFLNVLAPSFLMPALVAGGYSVMRRARAGSAGDVGSYIALGLMLLYATIEVRNAFHAALPFGAAPVRLAEMGLYAIVWTSFALLLAALGSPKRIWIDNSERIVFTIAIAIAVFGLGLGANPLFAAGADLSEADGSLFLNPMTPSYLAPAALLLAYAVMRRRQGRETTGHVAGFAGLALLFLYASLEVRNFFHTDLSFAGEPIVQAETYAYSIVWILFAVATLIIGVMRRRVAIRHAAMAVLALSVAKVFVFDMASLDGVLRAASFLGLGVALIGIAFLYQRLIFRYDPKPIT